jgi:hypothetical protein
MLTVRFSTLVLIRQLIFRKESNDDREPMAAGIRA